MQRLLPADLIMGHRMNVPSPMNPVTCTSVEEGELLMNKAAATGRRCFPACIQTSIYINLNFKGPPRWRLTEQFLKAFLAASLTAATAWQEERMLALH